jgi:NADPH2:quinone reductase
MKAIRVHEFGPPSVMRLEDVPDPEAGPGEVLVEVRAVGVNPVDTYVRAGTYARLPELPFVPGNDAAGVVRALGPGVGGVAPGDSVYLTGTASGPNSGAYAGLTCSRADQVKPLPPGVSFSQGAALGVPYATAYVALFIRGRALPGEKVLIHGASGGVGTAAVQLARAAGLTVIGTAGSERGAKLVSEQGAHHVLDHSRPDYLDGLDPVDVIVENLANVNLARDLEVLAKYGRVVVVGNRGTIEINPRAAMARNASILGMQLWNATDAELARTHAALGAGLANGTLRPIIGREMSLAEAAQAHEAVMEPGAYGKIVLIP